VKCFGQPAWMPLGLEMESLVVGTQAECRVGSASSGEQVVRARNYSLMSYDIGITSACLSTRLYYPHAMQGSSDERVWKTTFTVPFSLDEGGLTAAESQELAKIKDSASAADQNIAINLTAAARRATGQYVLPEFIIQVDVTK
jgi:hypothetical protein